MRLIGWKMHAKQLGTEQNGNNLFEINIIFLQFNFDIPGRESLQTESFISFRHHDFVKPIPKV